MMFIKENKCKDMYFVCIETIKDEGYKIVRVFYSKSKAREYIKESKRT